MTMRKYKTSGNRGLFDEEENRQKLSDLGNPLKMISKVIDFEILRASIEDRLLYKDKKNQKPGQEWSMYLDLWSRV